MLRERDRSTWTRNKLPRGNGLRARRIYMEVEEIKKLLVIARGAAAMIEAIDTNGSVSLQKRDPTVILEWLLPDTERKPAGRMSVLRMPRAKCA